MIESIVMKNIKGQDTVQNLTGKDIIIGLNGVGKTTRLQALGISLLGYVPGQGKVASETYKLASGETLTVGLNTEDFSFIRSFKKSIRNRTDGSTSVSVKQDIQVSPSKGEKKNADKEARIISEVGNFPVMLDFNEFLSLSDSKRREFIYNLAGFKSEEWNKEKVKDYLEDNLLTMDLEINNPDQYEIMKETIEEVLNEYPEKFDIQTGLQSMIDWTKNKLSFWKKEKDKSQSAVKKIAELKNKLKDTDRNLKLNKEEIETLQTEFTKIQTQIAKDTEKKKAIDDRLNKIDQLKQEIAVLEKQENPDSSEQLKQLIEIEKKKIVVVDYTEQIKILKQERLNKNKTVDELGRELKSLYVEITKLESTVDVYNSPLKAIAEQSGLCVIDKRIKCDKDFTAFEEYSKKQIDVLSQKISKLKTEYENKEAELNKLRKLANEAEKKEDDLIAKEAKHQKNNNLINFNINGLENRLNKANNFKELKQEKIKFKKEELSKLQNSPIEAIAPIDILEKQREGIKGQISELKVKIEEQEKAKITLSNLKATMIDSKKAEYYTLSFKSLDEVLGAKGLQGELVKETLEPIQKDIQQNLKIMGIENEFYFRTESERGKEIFQFGWKDKFGDRRNFDALSTGQQMILLIAMMTTFIEKANPKIKVLAIDNIENLDKSNFAKVIKGLNEIDYKLDNIILSGVIDVEHIEGFKVWNLSEKAGEKLGKSA